MAMKQITPKLRVLLGTLTLAIPFDWVTKLWIDQNLIYGDRIPVLDGVLYVSHVRNPGAAFGLFASSPELFRRIFFVGVTILAVALIISFFRRLAPRDCIPAFALGLIFSGACGNMIDRLWRGEVVDFIHFRLPYGYSWPDFNFADSYIVVGVLILAFELLLDDTKGNRGASP